MPAYLTHVPTWQAIWPVFLLSLIIGITSYFICYRRTDRIDITLIAVAFSTLGLVSGYLTSLSRQPAIGDLMPAALSLIGALSIYMIGNKQESRVAVSVGVVVFSCCLLVGANWGAVTRAESEHYLKSKDYRMQQILLEKEIDEFKQALGIAKKTPNKAN